MAENNKKVIKKLYNEGYNMKEISLLTNHSLISVVKCLKIKNA